MTNDLATRLATSPDAATLAALVNSAYRGESSKVGWTTEADLLGGQRVDADRVIETIAAPENVILVHDRRGTPVACVHLERTGDACYLGMLTIRPDLQGMGLGRQLLEAAERWAVDRWAARSMHMTVIAQRLELIAWYERRGYQRTGRSKPFPYGDVRFGIPRRRDLRFEILRKELSA